MSSILIRRWDFAQSAKARRACSRRQATTPYAIATPPGITVGGMQIQARNSTCPRNAMKNRPKKRKNPPIAKYATGSIFHREAAAWAAGRGIVPCEVRGPTSTARRQNHRAARTRSDACSLTPETRGGTLKYPRKAMRPQFRRPTSCSANSAASRSPTVSCSATSAADARASSRRPRLPWSRVSRPGCPRPPPRPATRPLPAPAGPTGDEVHLVRGASEPRAGPRRRRVRVLRRRDDDGRGGRANLPETLHPRQQDRPGGRDERGRELAEQGGLPPEGRRALRPRPGHPQVRAVLDHPDLRRRGLPGDEGHRGGYGRPRLDGDREGRGRGGLRAERL